MGIFGLGRIGNIIYAYNSLLYWFIKFAYLKGLAIAKRIQNFGVNKIIYNNRRVNQEAAEQGYEHVDLDTLLRESDFLICTCAATKETEKFFNLDIFRRMKPSAVFLNISRGSVVNQDDLCVALKENLIAVAGQFSDFVL